MMIMAMVMMTPPGLASWIRRKELIMVDDEHEVEEEVREGAKHAPGERLRCN